MDIVSAEQWQTELVARRRAVWGIAQQNECDLVLIYGGPGHTDPFRYLTNFVPVLGDGWAIMRSPSDLVCVLNFTWQLEEAREVSGIKNWNGAFDPLPMLREFLSSTSIRRMGVIGLHRIPVTSYEVIRAAQPDIELLDIGAPIAVLRRVKTPLELSLLREACHITDAAFDDIRAWLRPGLNELEVAARLAFTMQRLGARLSFEPTVISGNNKPITIRMPTNRKIASGDTIMIDIGAEFQGYQADASRTFVLGEPSAAQRAAWDVVQAAYDVALAALGPGKPCNETHTAALRVIEGAGYKLAHRIGHGIGLSTSFEWPSLDSETALQEPGMTFCIEPGVYGVGFGNMKLEDDVVVTTTGYELLTHSASTLNLSD